MHFIILPYLVTMLLPLEYKGLTTAFNIPAEKGSLVPNLWSRDDDSDNTETFNVNVNISFYQCIDQSLTAGTYTFDNGTSAQNVSISDIAGDIANSEDLQQLVILNLNNTQNALSTFLDNIGCTGGSRMIRRDGDS